MFLHINEVQLLGDFRLRLTFNDGVVKDVDLSEELFGSVFEPLQEAAYFRQVTINPETKTIEWPNGADFAPEFLYELGREPIIQEKL
ncbi:MAG: DUF2442 domain-containing protein [Anaerolineae bacterium]|nr:DUF2442 domain-containing protein [Anaerolineae bacterium]MCO5191542.1 DUF2442 domain-containing protein [Anaerolineae bacterium]MCO5196127.1 DUF2442 domain-containing protein [Anaerolineae bacterium]MCO5196637.1 DUF2442 domain-containing protein [Anaerolineae bacterium]MCO5207371.1 DUF2442 domain-containing protein [Anaerolineae bacterium]